MTPGELVTALTARGVVLTVKADRLAVNAPLGALTDELRAELKRHKTALIARFAQPGLCDVAIGPTLEASTLAARLAGLQPGDVITIAGDHVDQDRRTTEVIAAAQSELLTLFDAWECADNPADPKWRRIWAEVSIAAGLACYEIRRTEHGEWFQIDAGAAGWRMWAMGSGAGVGV